MGILGLVVLAAAAAVGVALVELVIRRTDVGAALVFATLLLLDSSLFDLYRDVGPVRVTIRDVLFVVLLTAAIARLLRAGRFTTTQRLLVVFGVLVAWSLLRGFEPYGIPAALNQGRKFLGFFAAALYFSTMEPRRDLLDRIGQFWMIAAACFCAISLFRWVATIAGVTGSFVEGAYGGGGSLRAIPAAETLIIAQAAWIALPMLGDRSRGLLRFLSPTFFAFVVVLQHRTIWILTAAGTVYLLYRQREIATRVLTALVAALAIFAGLTFTIFDDPDIAITDQLSSSAQSTGTFEWRMEGWIALLSGSGPETVEETLAGRPFGLPWARVMPNGRIVDVSPHSFYVEPYLRVGAVGLAALLLAYWIALRGTLTAARHDHSDAQTLSPMVLHTMLAAQLLFYITYSPDLAQAMLLGLGCAVAANRGISDERSVARVASER